MDTHTIISALIERGSSGFDGVEDYASEYGEPGYTARGPILLGSWWCRRRDCSYPDTYEDGSKKVHALDYHYPRVFAALEDAGAELEWYDEWTVVDDRAYRTTGDSYSWQPSIIYNDEIADYMIAGEDAETWIEWATNDPTHALMTDSVSDADIADAGFVEHQCDYEDGWYGVNDDPAAIMSALREREFVDVLFKLSGTEQFRVTWCVYVRESRDDALCECCHQPIVYNEITASWQHEYGEDSDACTPARQLATIGREGIYPIRKEG